MFKELKQFRHRLELMTALVILFLMAASTYVYYYHFMIPKQRVAELRELVIEQVEHNEVEPSINEAEQ